VINIENLKEMESSGFQKNEVKSAEYISLVHDKAMDILRAGDPIAAIMEQFSKAHIGDTHIGELLLLSIASGLCNNTEGLHLSLTGPSGKGKTDSCKVMGYLMPPEYFYSGSLSNKALLYMGIKQGSVVLADDTDSLGEDMERILKSSISHYQSGYKHSYVDFKSAGSNKTKEAWIPPRTTFWVTSVHASFCDQVLNRLVKVDVDDSPEQNRCILEHVLDCAVTGKYTYTDTFDVEVCREIFRQLKQMPPCSVSIPFAKQLEKYPQVTRNLKMFLDLVRASAALYQFQRNPTADRCITATKEDFERAVGLWRTINRAQTTGLTGEEQKVFDVIVAAGSSGISNKELEQKTGMKRGSIWRAINGKREKGSGELKGGIRNKVVGLSYDRLNDIWIYEGILEIQEDTVRLKESPQVVTNNDGCSQLHPVAEPCNSEITA
jgi:hypothetical protein